MGTVIWVFYNIMPWIGVVYFIEVLILYAFGLTEKTEPFTSCGAIGFAGNVGEYSRVTSFVPLMILFIILWLVEKVMGLFGYKFGRDEEFNAIYRY